MAVIIRSQSRHEAQYNSVAEQLYPSAIKGSQVKQAIIKNAGSLSDAAVFASPVMGFAKEATPLVSNVVNAVQGVAGAYQSVKTQRKAAEESVLSSSRRNKALLTSVALATPVVLGQTAAVLDPVVKSVGAAVLIGPMAEAAPFALGAYTLYQASEYKKEAERARQKLDPENHLKNRLAKLDRLLANPSKGDGNDRSRLVHQAMAMDSLLAAESKQHVQVELHRQAQNLSPLSDQTQSELLVWLFDKQKLKYQSAKDSARIRRWTAAGSILSGCAVASSSIPFLAILFGVASGVCYAAAAFFKGLVFWKNKQSEAVQQDVFKARIIQMAETDSAFAAQLQALHNLHQQHQAIHADKKLSWWGARRARKALVLKIEVLALAIKQSVGEDIVHSVMHLAADEPVAAYLSPHGLQMKLKQYCDEHQKEAAAYLHQRQQGSLGYKALDKPRQSQAQSVTPFASQHAQSMVDASDNHTAAAAA